MTTEERIAQIAQGFGQGFQNFQQGQQRQQAQALQAEALKRQQLLQALDVSSKLSEQSGRQIGINEANQYLSSGDYSGIENALKTGQMTQKAEMLAQAKASLTPRENLTYQQKLDMKTQHELESEKFKKPTSDQRKVATFAQRVSQAEKDFNALEEKGFNRGSNKAAAEGYLPSVLKSENVKLQDQAERNFVNAVLRRESGAAIAPTEFSSAEVQYFPRAGDTKQVIEQKRKNREIVMAGLRAEAGGRAMSEIEKEIEQSKTPSIKEGIIEDGYKFKGGDPSDSKNWEKV